MNSARQRQRHRPDEKEPAIGVKEMAGSRAGQVSCQLQDDLAREDLLGQAARATRERLELPGPEPAQLATGLVYRKMAIPPQARRGKRTTGRNSPVPCQSGGPILTSNREPAGAIPSIPTHPYPHPYR